MDGHKSALAALQTFLDRLDSQRVVYRLDRIREASVMVEVYVPGVHWEIEFFDNGEIEVERYAATLDGVLEASSVADILKMLGPLD